MNTIRERHAGLKVRLTFFLTWLFVSSPLFAAQRLELYLDYPLFDGDFYAEGIVSFPPLAVSGADNLAVYAADGSEIASKVMVLNSWGNGSVQKAQIIFPANAARRQKYALGFGEEIRRQKGFEQTAVLPTVPFYALGAPRAAENVNLNIGTINVLVDRSPGINYFWHIIPIAFLVWLTWHRARKIEGES